MQVNLLALGGGTETTMTAQTRTALLQAQCIVGAARLIERLPAECTPNRAAATKPQKILEALRAANCDRAAVVYSGDTGFYSGCRNLVPLLEEQGIAYTVFPGISSVQLMAAALHRPWQDWTLVSAHGVQCDAVAAVLQGKPTFFLTGGSLGVPQLCKQLTEAGLGDLAVTVGENLSYPDASVRTGRVAEMAKQGFGPLCVLLTEAVQQPPRRSPGWPDTWFERGKVPMTKRFVRAAAIAALGIQPEDVLWDVGAGTGSVSVELAAAAQKGSVYAVECEPSALELIRNNRQKFHTWNLHTVEGYAPQVLENLPAPDAIFVGGSKGEMTSILSAAIAKNPQARICVSCIALETLEAVLAFCREHNLEPQVVQLAASQAKSMGRLHLMMAKNPVFLVTVHCDD